MTIPFNKPYFPEQSRKYVEKVITSGKFSGDGNFTKEVAHIISAMHNNHNVLMTTSCTHALEMCSLLMELGPGDEVIIPSYTFTSAAIAVTNFGATPVFVDVEPESKNINSEEVLRAITPATKAISFVNYAGNLADVTQLKKIADDNGLFLIEDNAHGLGATSSLGPVGTFGDLSTYSFHETKNFHCGEGGALVINNAIFEERAEILREKGTDRSRFFRGAIDKYQWVDKGSSYLPSEILMAVLLGQLESFSEVQDRRVSIWNQYNIELSEWGSANNFQLTHQSEISSQSAHMYYLISPSLDVRQRFIEHLSSRNISSVFHYQDLGSSLGGEKLGRTPSNTPTSKMLSDQLVRLPLWFEMKDSDTAKIIAAVKEFE